MQYEHWRIPVWKPPQGARTRARLLAGPRLPAFWPPSRKVMRLANRLREHRLFWLGFPLLIAVMTWPLVARGLDPSVFWLPTEDNDSWMKFWDAWYLQFILADAGNYLFTDKLFHPSGLSLVYHNFSFPHMLLLNALQRVMPASNAFNLSFLLIVFLNGAAAYLYLSRLFRQPWIGFYGALVFALGPFVLSQPHHPDVIFIATLPLTLYFLDRGVKEGRWYFVALASVVFATTLLIGMYIFVCLCFTVAFFALGYVRRHRSSPAFWRSMLVFALIAGSATLARVYPLIENSSSLADALTKRGGEEVGNDLLGSFVNRGHPLFLAATTEETRQQRPNLGVRSYLGYAPLCLALIGIGAGPRRRRLAPWLLLLLAFFVLRLGSALEVNGQSYEQFLLPKHYLDQLLPIVFESFWETENFQIGAVLPLAALACFGLSTLLKRLPAKRQAGLVLLALMVTGFDYLQVHNPRVLPNRAAAFLDWLRAEDDQERIGLIHLPMGRHESKLYGYFQSLSGYPHVEGLASRTPPSAYDYIRENLFLNSWRKAQTVHCLPASRARYLSELERLRADGFTHVALHLGLWRSGLLARGFAGFAPAYEDDYTRVYRLRQLPGACDSYSLPLPESLAYLRQLAQSDALIADEGVSILSLHPAERQDNETLHFASSVFQFWKRFEHIYFRDGQLLVRSAEGDQAAVSRLLDSDQLIILTYHPSHAESEALGAIQAELSRDFRACQRFLETEGAVAEYHLRADFPCELVAAPGKFAVEYDNQLRLENLLQESDGAALNLAAWWTNKPSQAHAVSFQAFDANDNKRAGQDFTLGSKSLAHYRLDLSALEPGDYVLKLILYHYETRASVGGVVQGDQTRFERELEIGSFTIN